MLSIELQRVEKPLPYSSTSGVPTRITDDVLDTLLCYGIMMYGQDVKDLNLMGSKELQALCIKTTGGNKIPSHPREGMCSLGIG